MSGKYSGATSPTAASSNDQNYWDSYNPHRRQRPSDYNDSIRITNSNIRTDGLNETFTSQKAKRNVSEYHNSANTRPVFSREREQPSQMSKVSPGFSIIGLENIGNT